MPTMRITRQAFETSQQVPHLSRPGGALAPFLLVEAAVAGRFFPCVFVYPSGDDDLNKNDRTHFGSSFRCLAYK